MHAASRPTPTAELLPCTRGLTTPCPCAYLHSPSLVIITVTHALRRTTSPTSSSTRHVPPHRPAAKRPTRAYRSSSCGRRARVLAARARQHGACSPCPRLAAQRQLASLPVYPIVCLGSRSLASTAPFAASCLAPQPSSHRAHVDPLLLPPSKPSAQGLP